MSYRIIIDDNPANNEINKNYLYYPGDPRYTLNDIQLDLEIGGAGQLKFTIYRDHPNYSMIELGYKHIFMYEPETDSQLVLRSHVLFNGLITEIQRGVNREMTVYCTGILSVLNYTTQPQAKYDGVISSYFDRILLNHNDRVETNEASCYEVHRGSCSAGAQSGIRYTNYETTLECIRRDIMEPFGLYPRLHYDQAFGWKFPILDLVPIETYGSLSSQEIRIGENLIKYVDERNTDNIYTAVIPLGKKKSDSERTSTDVRGLEAYVDIRSVNNNDVVLANSAAVSQYGFKCAVVHFDDITTPATLKTRGQEWLDAATASNLSISLSAVDLSLMDVNYDEFKLGDRIRCYIEPLNVDITLPIYEMTIYPLAPEKNMITLGAEAPKITSSSASGSASGGSEIEADVENGSRNSQVTASRANCRLLKVGNIVFITVALGNVSSSPATSTTLFTIPASYRPTETKTIQGIINNAEGNVTIDSSGNVKQTLTGSMTSLFASGFYTI